MEIDEKMKEEDDTKEIFYCVDEQNKNIFKCKIIYKGKDVFSVFPFYKEDDKNKIVKKYKKIHKITFEGFGGKIPSAGFKRFDKGYGFSSVLRPFYYFISSGDKLGSIKINEIVISKERETCLLRRKIIINFEDFDRIRRYLTIENKKLSSKKKIFINNLFSENINNIFRFQKPIYKRNTINYIINEHQNIENKLSNDDKNSILKIFDKISYKGLVGKKQFVLTKEKIDKKYIEDVLYEFERLLKLKKCSEEKWHKFFVSNPWIFNQIMLHPAVIFKSKAFVGGKTMDNQKGEIVDFMYQNKITKNSIIIEIKTHTHEILNKKPYRNNDIYSFNSETNGSISQILSQKYTYMKDFNNIAHEKDINSFSPKCILLMGKTFQDPEKIKSFELLRNSLKDVEIITYDELFEKIKSILKIFNTN